MTPVQLRGKAYLNSLLLSTFFFFYWEKIDGLGTYERGDYAFTSNISQNSDVLAFPCSDEEGIKNLHIYEYWHYNYIALDNYKVQQR